MHKLNTLYFVATNARHLQSTHLICVYEGLPAGPKGISFSQITDINKIYFLQVEQTHFAYSHLKYCTYTIFHSYLVATDLKTKCSLKGDVLTQGGSCWLCQPFAELCSVEKVR